MVFFILPTFCEQNILTRLFSIIGATVIFGTTTGVLNDCIIFFGLKSSFVSGTNLKLGAFI
jgi:hypothetical protein